MVPALTTASAVSANSDSAKLLKRAEELGLTIEKTKHSGYVIRDSAGEVVTRVRTGSHQPWHWVRAARRALEEAGAR